MDVVLPKWGMTMQEAIVAEWLVAVGDPVTEGEPIARIESDKVETDMEAPASGTLTAIVVPAGEEAAVGSVIARIEP